MNSKKSDEVTNAAHPPPNGSVFDTWVIESGDPVLDDPFESQTTLTMGAGSASVLATYKKGVGIQENDGLSQEIRIYPNPADSEVRISLNLEEQSELRLSIFRLASVSVNRLLIWAPSGRFPLQ